MNGNINGNVLVWWGVLGLDAEKGTGRGGCITMVTRAG